MEIITIIIYIAAALEIMMGTVVLFSDPKNKVNRLFAIVSLVTAYWILTNSLISLEPNEFWVKNAYATGIILTPTILIWLNYFLNKKNTKSIVIKIITITAIILYFCSLFSDLIIKHVTVSFTGGFDGVFGPLFPLYAFHFAAVSVYILFLATRAFKNSHGVEKVQYKYIALGLYGFGLVVGTVNFILPIFGITFLIPLDSTSSIIFISAISFAILRHNLFNVKVIATELITFTLWIFILIRVLIAETLQETIIEASLLVITVIIGIFLIRSVIKEVKQREKIQKLAIDLQGANDRLKELDREKSEFVSFATHQLRAPLTAMKGYSSLILEGEMGTIPAEARTAVSRIFESTMTLASIVDDYLNVSRIELGSIRYTFETINLKDLVENVIAELKPNIDKAQNVNFKLDISDPQADYRITADKDKLKQVIANLVDNSIKYTPKGNVHVSLIYDKVRHKLVFKVQDTGIGISPEILPKLFQKWSRADNANKTNIKGTGLGLYVAKEIINAHHASIRAESPGEGKGSTFIVEVEPLAP